MRKRRSISSSLFERISQFRWMRMPDHPGWRNILAQAEGKIDGSVPIWMIAGATRPFKKHLARKLDAGIWSRDTKG
jgi:hypothetical protein